MSVLLYLPKPSLRSKTQVILKYLQRWLRKQFYKYEELVGQALVVDSKPFKKAKHKLAEKFNECAWPMNTRCTEMVMEIHASCQSVRKELLAMAVNCNLKMQKSILRIDKWSHLKNVFILSPERLSSRMVKELKTQLFHLITSGNVPHVSDGILHEKRLQSMFSQLLYHLWTQMEVAVFKLNKCNHPNIWRNKMCPKCHKTI